VTRYGKYTGIEYTRFAGDLVILVDATRGMTGASANDRSASGQIDREIADRMKTITAKGETHSWVIELNAVTK
jgi:hypothetical protein